MFPPHDDAAAAVSHCLLEYNMKQNKVKIDTSVHLIIHKHRCRLVDHLTEISSPSHVAGSIRRRPPRPAAGACQLSLFRNSHFLATVPPAHAQLQAVAHELEEENGGQVNEVHDVTH